MADLGYDVAEVSTDSVSWRSGPRTLLVSRDWRDGFLDTHFGEERDEHGLSFGLRQALTAGGSLDAWPSHGWQAWRAETVEKYITELATIVQGRLSDFLRGQPELWAAADKLAADEAHEYWDDHRSRQWRGQGEAARIAGDWPEVAKAYQRLRDAGFRLTDAEEARLHYALGQIADA